MSASFSPAIREFLALTDEKRRLGPYLCKEPLDRAGAAPVFRAVEEHAGLSLREVAVKVFDIGRSRGGDCASSSVTLVSACSSAKRSAAAPSVQVHDSD